MDEFTPEFIAEQLALAAKATPRPWAKLYEFNIAGASGNRSVAACGGYSQYPHQELAHNENTANTDYIIAAANNYPAALEEIARLRVTVDAMKTDLIIAFGLIRRAVELLPLDDIGKLEGVRAWQETVHLSDEEAEG